MIGKRSLSDWALDIFIYVFMIIVLIMVLYPFLNSLAISLNHAEDTARGGITIWPRELATESYRSVINNPRVPQAYRVTISRTLIGTVAALFCTGILAYGLAHANLIGRKWYAIICLVPMYFAGGIIPTFLMIRAMGMINSFSVFIIPSLIGLFNIILMRTYFQSLPESLEESAMLDGANYLTIFFKIIVPISMPIIATIALFVGVGHWNDWYVAHVYIPTNDSLRPMQNVLLGLINEARMVEAMAALPDASGVQIRRPANTRSITSATMFVTIVPIIMVYPFLQRFFIKGIMIGSVKG